MLKHQRLFLSMEQRVSSGQDLFDQYRVSLEEFQEMMDLLSRAERRDATVVPVVQARFGDAVPVEISLESVQVHINSAQVDAIAQFLRKWIPIVLRKLREIITQVIQWVQEKLRALEPRLKTLQADLKRWTRNEVELQYGSSVAERLAAGLTKNRRWDLLEDKRDGVGDLLYVASRVGELVDKQDITGELSTLLRRFESGIVGWLGFDHRSAKLGHYAPGAEPLTDAQTYLRGLTNPIELMAEGMQQLPVGGIDASGGRLTLSKSQALTLAQQLDTMQLFINRKAQLALATARKTEGMLAQLEHSTYSTQFDTQMRSTGPSLQVLIRLIERTESALGLGLQKRLSLIGSGVAQLERSLR